MIAGLMKLVMRMDALRMWIYRPKSSEHRTEKPLGVIERPEHHIQSPDLVADWGRIM